MNNRLFFAKTFARERHGKQMYGEFPYFVHLDAVAKLAEPFGQSAVIVAQLHDVLEDTGTTYPELLIEFGDVIADAVCYVTDPILSTRPERKRLLNERLATLDTVDEASRIALIVKACDRLANVKASRLFLPEQYEKYRLEHTEFRAAVYRPLLCDKIWVELDWLIQNGEGYLNL
ncbi:phosphohydrolase [Parasalinivibrio latis]|uniref:phosphohydrolase n=1 Tax=Parasalinivibrio latis TaxID=2952610 RepID=UPI0030E170C4